MKVRIIDPTIEPLWDEFLSGQENSTIYHTSAWARVIKEAYGYLPRYYVLENEDGRYKAAIPFFGIKSRLSGKRLVCLLPPDSVQGMLDAGREDFVERGAGK